jgi:hypothetical protein
MLARQGSVGGPLRSEPQVLIFPITLQSLRSTAVGQAFEPVRVGTLKTEQDK